MTTLTGVGSFGTTQTHQELGSLESIRGSGLAGATEESEGNGLPLSSAGGLPSAVIVTLHRYA